MMLCRWVLAASGIAVCAAGLGAAEIKVPEMQAKHSATEKPLPELSPVARQLKISGHVELTVKMKPEASAT